MFFLRNSDNVFLRDSDNMPKEVPGKEVLVNKRKKSKIKWNLGMEYTSVKKEKYESRCIGDECKRPKKKMLWKAKERR